MRLLPERRGRGLPDIDKDNIGYRRIVKGRSPDTAKTINNDSVRSMTPYQKARQAEDRERVCPKK